MKHFRLFSIIFALMLFASLSTYADSKHHSMDSSKASKMEMKKDSSMDMKHMKMKDQTNCPVMGGEIDSSIYTDIQGQRVYHCCPMCSAKLKADPDKFFKQAAKDGVIFENIQTTCPVSGEKLVDKSVFVDFEGRRVVFCCKKCRGAFNEDPQKFLSKLEPVATKKATKESKESHEGHNH